MSRQIEQLDSVTGEILARYDSIADAARDLLGPNVSAKQLESIRGNINQCANKITKTARGYFWRFRGDTDFVSRLPRSRDANLDDKIYEMRRTINQYNNPVQQIDKDTLEVVATHISIKAAERATGCSQGNICSVLNGRLKSCGGFYWKRIGEAKATYKRSNELKERVSKKLKEYYASVPHHRASPIKLIFKETGIVLGTFQSITELSNAIGVQPQSINALLRGHMKTVKNGLFIVEKIERKETNVKE